MRKLLLKSPHFTYLEKAFKEWLDILGYAPATVYTLPNCLRELFHWLEHQGYTQIQQIDTPLLHRYYSQLSQRTNQKRSGALSNNYLNTHLLAFDKLAEYLRKNADITLPNSGMNREPVEQPIITPLTTEQIRCLYEATTNHEAKQLQTAQRDRAILAIFYDCGLRRTEGVQLNLTDINFESRMIHVRHAKGGQQRLVPFNHNTANKLMDYRYEARPKYAQLGKESAAFFLNHFGTRASGSALNNRLKQIQQHTDDTELKQRPLHLHLLRHSIATHLLYAGMTLEKVAQFLGHKSLNSTQIYTHVMNENQLAEGMGL